MKRRDVLATTAVLVSAGCLGGDGAGGTTGAETTDESTMRTETRTVSTAKPTETDTETPIPATETETSTVAEPAGTATETGEPIPIPDAPTDGRKDTPLTGEADVAFENGGSRVVVTGTIVGQNGCQTAVLDSVRNTESGLVITVATERDAATDAACSLALVDIEYRFVVSVDGTPASVTVVHRGATGRRTMTTVNPDD